MIKFWDNEVILSDNGRDLINIEVTRMIGTKY